MFNFSQLKQIHLEITNNCQASCPMCARNINGGVKNPLIKLNDWTLDDFKSVMTEEVLGQIDSYYFCGNFGDPIVNGDLLEMCRYSVSTNDAVGITIHTNGSAKSKDWWKSLAHTLPKNHRVVFALDGLADTHKLYRVGTDFDRILENASVFINNGGNAEWVFIRFKHNQHQVEEARQLSVNLGFSKFTVKNSSRFFLKPYVNVINRLGEITHTIEPATDTPIKFIDKSAINNIDSIVRNASINCLVQESREVYIDAFKKLYPCCYIGAIPYLHRTNIELVSITKQMQDQHASLMNDLKENDTSKKSIKDIIDSNEFQTVWEKYWGPNKLIVCAKTCGANLNFSRPAEQVLNKDK